MQPIVDAHLDLAWNHRKGRDLTLSVDELRAAEARTSQQIMVTLPEMSAGGVAVAFATLYTGTNTFDGDGNGVYDVPPDVDAQQQLDIYHRWRDEGRVRIVTDRASLEEHMALWEHDRLPGLVILIEGGDSITSPDDLGRWWDGGVRVIGPAWSRTRYCGGTREPGGLTDMGRELLAAMADRGAILDVSHMAEASFWDAMELDAHRIVATHANVRAYVEERIFDRHLSDEMMGALRAKDAVIGIVPANAFLATGQLRANAPALGLDVVQRHLEHIAAIVGWERVGIGSDLDGGFGLEETPTEMERGSDLRKLATIVPPEAADGVLGENWLRVLREALPS